MLYPTRNDDLLGPLVASDVAAGSATSRPLRLALVGHQAFAMLNFRSELIADLTARGIEVFALAPNLESRDEARLRDLGATPLAYHLNRNGISPLQDCVSAIQLFRALKAIRPDKVLCFAVKPVVFGTLAAWLAAVPHRYALVEGLGRPFTDAPGERRPVLRRIVVALYRLALSKATRTLFLNHDDKAYFVHRGVVTDHGAEVIGGIGVDLEAFEPAPLPRGPVTFLLAARLLREKGVLDFIEAARQVRRLHRDVRFVVLGRPERHGAVSEARMQKAVAEGIVEWPGHVPVLPWLQQASVFVLPSYYREGVPRSIQEAMAVGRAVITTDMPGCRDAVVHGDNGLLVAPRNPGQLAEAMLACIRDPLMIERMGRRSRALAEERFDVRHASARTLSAIGL